MILRRRPLCSSGQSFHQIFFSYLDWSFSRLNRMTLLHGVKGSSFFCKDLYTNSMSSRTSGAGSGSIYSLWTPGCHSLGPTSILTLAMPNGSESLGGWYLDLYYQSFGMPNLLLTSPEDELSVTVVVATWLNWMVPCAVCATGTMALYGVEVECLTFILFWEFLLDWCSSLIGSNVSFPLMKWSSLYT